MITFTPGQRVEYDQRIWWVKDKTESCLILVDILQNELSIPVADLSQVKHKPESSQYSEWRFSRREQSPFPQDRFYM